MTSLVYAHAPVSYSPDVGLNQKSMRQAMKKAGIDILVVSSADAFLSEYTPLVDHERFALSGFSGSTGDGIFVSEELQAAYEMSSPFVLMVDGRYHIQADAECNPRDVEVRKLSMTQSPTREPLEWVKAAAQRNLLARNLVVAVDGPRTSWDRYVALGALCQNLPLSLVVLGGDDVSGPLALPGSSVDRPIKGVSVQSTGRTTAGIVAELQRRLPEGVTPEEACVITCASDDAAFLLNARGFHRPRAAGVLTWTFTVGQNLVVFLPDGVHEAPVDIDVRGLTLHVVRKDVQTLATLLRSFGDVKLVAFSASTTNAWLPHFASTLWPSATLMGNFGAISDIRAAKTPEEIESFRLAFLAASRAIARTLRWVRASVGLKDGAATSDPDFTAPLSEWSVTEKIQKEYVAEGAVELSFSTISGVDENGAIVHYSGASREKLLRPGSMLLLDSGAYFGEGFPTDCTRVAACPGGVSDWQKRIYTACLKGFVAGMRAEFPKVATGKEVDAIVRSVVVANGYDFGHGTGHGIGIHVHESGHGIGTVRMRPLVESGLVSMEPGVYLSGQGGVRIENVVVVREHPVNRDHFHFQNLLWVGLDWDLVDVTQLDEGECLWLANYEKSCAELGTSVTKCPLTV